VLLLVFSADSTTWNHPLTSDLKMLEPEILHPYRDMETDLEPLFRKCLLETS